MGFNDVQKRATTPVPEPMANEIIKGALETSVLLSRARKTPMSSKTQKQPVLTGLPTAGWITGDEGLIGTSKAEFQMPIMTAEDLGVIVPIPNDLFEDSNVPLWEEIKPLLIQEISSKIDNAGLFGVGAPSTWGAGIVPGAVAAGMKVVAGADITSDATKLGKSLAGVGFNLDGFVAAKGFQWELNGLRTTAGVPVYQPPSNGLGSGTIYGVPVDEFGSPWPVTTPASKLIGIDWSKIMVGVRKDMDFQIFDQMVINDATGKVIYNTAQQGGKALRVIMRVGFLTLNPATLVQPDATKRYPAAVLTA